MSLDDFADAGNYDGDDTAAHPVRWPSPLPGIDVYSAGLARPQATVDALLRQLSPAEQARAARFGGDELRSRYIVGRATLRAVLGQRLGREPARVEISRGPRGRPFVVDGGGLDFNVSHTGDVAVFALIADARIGIDIEHEARTLNVDGVARKFMSPAERDSLQMLDDDARRQTLLRLWTCKEAMSKATGDALSAPFRAMTVTLGDPVHLSAGPPPYTPAAWRLAVVAGPAKHLVTVARWTGR